MQPKHAHITRLMASGSTMKCAFVMRFVVLTGDASSLCVWLLVPPMTLLDLSMKDNFCLRPLYCFLVSVCAYTC